MKQSICRIHMKNKSYVPCTRTQNTWNLSFSCEFLQNNFASQHLCQSIYMDILCTCKFTNILNYWNMFPNEFLCFHQELSLHCIFPILTIRWIFFLLLPLLSNVQFGSLKLVRVFCRFPSITTGFQRIFFMQGNIKERQWSKSEFQWKFEHHKYNLELRKWLFLLPAISRCCIFLGDRSICCIWPPSPTFQHLTDADTNGLVCYLH